MRSYTVYEPPNPPADRVDRAEGMVFIKDGFSWTAALFGPLWMLYHWLWWPLLGFLVVTATFNGLGRMTVIDAKWLGLAWLALHILIGFEADALRRWTLERRGWRMAGAVTGRNAEESERRFFESWLPGQPIITPAAGSAPPRAPRRWPVFGSLLGARS
jgi:hypothetical protein